MLFKVWGNSKEKAVVADSLTDLLKKGTLFKQIFSVDFRDDLHMHILYLYIYNLINIIKILIKIHKPCSKSCQP
jgi:hypothetical protein